MAIVVEHTPYEAMHQLAVGAGQAQAERERSAFREKQQLMQLQNQLETKQMQFQEEAASRAREEEFQYTIAAVQAKRQVDLQIETADYARQKQKLSQTLNMIRESNDLSDAEKEELLIQAMSKYSGVGTGIGPSSFTGGTSSGMQNFLMKGAYKAKMGETLQQYVDEGLMSTEDAERQASYFDIGGDFKNQQQVLLDQSVDAQKRLDSAQDMLGSNFSVDKKGRIRDAYGVEVKEGTPRYELYKTMQAQVDTAKRALDAVHEEGQEIPLWTEFKSLLNSGDPGIKKAVEVYGEDMAFEAYKRNRKVGPKDKKFYQKHPVIDMVMRGISPAFNLARFSADMRRAANAGS